MVVFNSILINEIKIIFKLLFRIDSVIIIHHQSIFKCEKELISLFICTIRSQISNLLMQIHNMNKLLSN